MARNFFSCTSHHMVPIVSDLVHSTIVLAYAAVHNLTEHTQIGADALHRRRSSVSRKACPAEVCRIRVKPIRRGRLHYGFYISELP